MLKFDLEVLTRFLCLIYVTVYEDYGSIFFQVFSSEMALYVS